MADQELRFESEAAKADAIAKYDESKGTADELSRLMNATVSPAEKAAEAEIKPPQSQPVETAVPKPVPGEAEIKPPQAGGVIDADSWAREKGYKSFAEAKKAFDEKEELLKRQQKFIEEKINAQPAQSAQFEALTKRNQELEQTLASMKSPQPAPTTPGGTQKQIQTTESKIGVIKQALNNNLLKKKELVAQLRTDPSLQMDPNFLVKSQEVEEEKFNLDMQLADEMGNLRSLYETTSKQLQDFTTKRDEDYKREQGQKVYEAEMDEIDEFATNKAHPEFAFSEGKDSRAVEAEYVNWANKIASAFYASPVNMLRSEQDQGAVAYAMEKLRDKDPEALNACQVAGVPIEPSDDIRKYLDICELLDHRDGVKKNPLTGQKEQQTRVTRNPLTGQFEKTPVKFPSLEDAYQHKMAVDGVFNQRIKDAYTKGGKDMAAAQQKRAQAPVTLDNSTGVGNADVGLAMTPQQAIETLSKIDEQEAYRRKLSGDPSLWNQYEKAMEIVGAVKA